MIATTVTELPESRVRIEAEVPADEVERGVILAATALGRDMRLPGFRKGKVPAPVVIRRLGREAVLDEAVRSRLGTWYKGAIAQSGVATIGDPQISVGDLPGEGAPLTFTVEVGVRPGAKVGEWRGLEVPRREPTVDEEQLERQIEDLRQRHARLETVERAAAAGDFVVLDYEASVGGEAVEEGAARDQLIELGTGRLIDGFEEGLLGVQAGEDRVLDITFPDDYGAEQLAGKQAQLAISVHEVKEKLVPELNDDFALEAAGFDSLAELREDLSRRLREADERRVEAEFREAVLDAAAASAEVTVPDGLIDARARELFERTMHSLGHQGISKEAYLSIAGKSEDELIAESRPDAERSIRREAVLAALLAESGVEPSDEQLGQALAESIGPDEQGRPQDPAELLKAIRKAGRYDELREDVAARVVLDEMVQAAKPISPEAAAAREKLWTPGS